MRLVVVEVVLIIMVEVVLFIVLVVADIVFSVGLTVVLTDVEVCGAVVMSVLVTTTGVTGRQVSAASTSLRTSGLPKTVRSHEGDIPLPLVVRKETDSPCGCTVAQRWWRTERWYRFTI